MDEIAVQNLVPNFLEFYDHAKSAESADERWALWEKYYRFAAVPPGEEGYRLARNLLDASWGQYHAVISELENWEPDSKAIHEYIKRIQKTLHDHEEASFDITIVYFVGNFDGGAFVTPAKEGGLALCLPVEAPISDITLAHEITHIIHAKKAGLSIKVERYIATLIMQEGLATRISQHMVPGKNNQEYIGLAPGWLEYCAQKENEIFTGILPYLNKSDIDIVNKFTVGKGTTGITREAYYVGWQLIGFLEEKGVAIHRLLELDEDEIRKYVEETMLEYLSA